MSNHTKIIKKTLSDFINLSRYYSFSYAFYNLIWWLNFYLRTPFAYRISKFALLKKTNWLNKYIEKKYSDIIEQFRTDRNKKKTPVINPTIWVYWGQGKENMPKLIKSCYNQLVANNDNVVLVTNNNINKYIDIPKAIYEKLDNGKITWAHFSDIVRTSLLTKYGGLWLDATVWVPETISERIYSQPFFTACSKNTINNKSICFWTTLKWNWSGWCMGCNHTNNVIESFVSTMLVNMAEDEKYLLDYVLIDYMIYYACTHFPEAHRLMDGSQSIESSTRNQLAVCMNEEYSIEKYDELKEKSEVFKLSFRANWQPKTASGEDTFYGKLIQ